MKVWVIVLVLAVGAEARPARRSRVFVDVNRAGVEELAAVPGMGRKLAEAVVESRDRDGDFEHAAQLLRVKGMGPVKAPKLARYLSFPKAAEGPGEGEPWRASGERPQRPLDLNVSSAAELAPLPGMGWGMAYRILAERERNGAFRTLDDLHYVEGVTAERVGAWRAYLFVEGAP